MPRSLRIGLVAIVVMGALAGLYFWTVSMGRAGLRKLVLEDGYCTGETDCAEVEDRVRQFAMEDAGWSPAMLDWCLGVDEWAAADVRRGGAFKDALVWVMYLPCGSMTDSAPSGPLSDLPVIDSRDKMLGTLIGGEAAR